MGQGNQHAGHSQGCIADGVPEPGAVVAGERALTARCTGSRWVRSRISPSGSSGELILSTLFAVEPERRDEYVKGLSDRGVAGLMLAREVPRHHTPERARDRRPGVLSGGRGPDRRPLVPRACRLLPAPPRRADRAHQGGDRDAPARGFFDELLSGQISGRRSSAGRRSGATSPAAR